VRRACVPCASVHKIGREGAAAVASRLVGLVGLIGVLWRDSHQSPSRRPEQSEQLQGPLRVHLCGGAWEWTHRHRRVDVCLHDLGRRPTSSRSPSLHAAPDEENSAGQARANTRVETGNVKCWMPAESRQLTM
jgi:hypothetical protein